MLDYQRTEDEGVVTELSDSRGSSETKEGFRNIFTTFIELFFNFVFEIFFKFYDRSF